jgi:acylglycerol lipase
MAEYIEAWLPGPSNTQFYTRTYPSKHTPPKAYLVFLHGFIEHIARHTHIHTALAARGITVFAYDLRGYGRTALDVEKRSEGSKYGRSSWEALLGDCEWAVKRVREEAGGGKVFLMGHSMVRSFLFSTLHTASLTHFIPQGGELSLTFVTRPAAPPSKETVSFLTGVIATSPFIHQSHPAPKALRWVGGKVGKISPYMMIPANVKPQVRVAFSWWGLRGLMVGCG